MYFSLPSAEQATIGLVGSALSASSLRAAVQSFASYCLYRSAVIQLRSEPSVGSAVGLGSLSSAVRDPSATAAPSPATRTGRNVIFADA